MNAAPKMNEVTDIRELSEEQLDEVSGGLGWDYWKGALTAAACPILPPFGSALAVGVWNGYYESHH